ncbi:MAG: glutaredoxin family protein [Gammaproteobacteria bacterium]|nr:glutaredoxin family protein [Gammaproteobacteria bacterium]
MRTFKLFSTDGCHLCEQAIGMFYYAKQQKLIRDDTELNIIDIIDDAVLTEKYKLTIPVLRRSDEEELGWPFELEELVDWVNQLS